MVAAVASPGCSGYRGAAQASLGSREVGQQPTPELQMYSPGDRVQGESQDRPRSAGRGRAETRPPKGPPLRDQALQGAATPPMHGARARMEAASVRRARSAQKERVGRCRKLRSTAAPARELHAAANGGSRPSESSHHHACQNLHGAPSSWGPKQPSEASTLPQANAPAGKSLPAPCWSLNGDGGAPNDLHQPKFARSRFSSAPQRRIRPAAAPERPAGLHSDAQSQPERSPAPQSDRDRLTAATNEMGLIRMRRLRAMQQRQREGAKC